MERTRLDSGINSHHLWSLVGKIVVPTDKWGHRTGEPPFYRWDDSVETLSTLETGWGKSMSDSTIPNFHVLSARGEVFMNPCVRHFEITKPVNEGVLNVCNAYGIETIQSGAVSFHHGMQLGGYLPAPALSQVANAEALAKVKALSQINKTPFAFAESVAELNKTVNYLNGHFRKWERLDKNYSRACRRLSKEVRLGSVESHIQKASALWLEYRFAITPIVIDIENLATKYQQAMPTRRSLRQTARGIIKGSLTSTDVIKPSDYNLECHRTTKISYEARATVLYEVDNPIVDWHHNNGLGKLDILPTAWALVPYSWLIDRAINITNSIKAVQNFLDPSTKILGACYSEKQTIVSTMRVQAGLNYQSGGGYYYTGGGAPVSKETTGYTRAVWEPSIYDAMPVWNPKGVLASIGKIADVTSLITSRFRKYKNIGYGQTTFKGQVIPSQVFRP